MLGAARRGARARPDGPELLALGLHLGEAAGGQPLLDLLSRCVGRQLHGERQDDARISCSGTALLQLGIPFPVLEALVGQDSFDRLLLRDRDVLADVFLRPLVHEDVANEAFIRRHQNQQFVPAHALHPQDGLTFGVLMERADDMDGQLVLPPVQPIIELSGERVVLAILVVTNLPLLDDVVENDLLKLGGNIR